MTYHDNRALLIDAARSTIKVGDLGENVTIEVDVLATVMNNTSWWTVRLSVDGNDPALYVRVNYLNGLWRWGILARGAWVDGGDDLPERATIVRLFRRLESVGDAAD